MDVLDILVIEDSENHAKAILKTYEKLIGVLKEKNLLKHYLGYDNVTIRWEEGTDKEVLRNRERYSFYDESIYTVIRDTIVDNRSKGINTGILLDVSLSKEEYEKASVNDYSGYVIARNIFEEFDEQAGIYIITSIREFSSQVLSLMGTSELIRRYVSKALITEYPSYGAVARTIKYMHGKEVLSEQEEDAIEKLLEEEE